MTVVEQAGAGRRLVVRAAVREILLVGLLFLAYQAGRMLATGHVAEAMGNAGRVWELERALRLPAESSVQEAIIDHRFLVRLANCYYAYVHFPATAVTLVWMYLRRPAHYLWMRRTLACLTAVALVVHLVIPLAPPRMMAFAGVLDTGHLYGPAVYGSPAADAVSNQYAAMPSLHVGWAVAVAIALIAATTSRLRWLWLAHPVLTLAVVVATGNHYWLDAFVAVSLLGTVLLLLPGPRRSRAAAPEGVVGALPQPRTPVPALSLASSPPPEGPGRL
ncbi:phosphatase PAP2 family protein [Pseudosporangium ferrugineum]|uniref:PAP2 superfamily protein n=1 Tax=Pseudosporangium ferrugineum TaxID=439699 RepID=A0A2T0RX22_9ACTN|nr:phosphatase PAP2 family protein [Pseudosporangium ferrugineum]PRY25697.1 PAP2 superfamily protein [Pseudosporangium ferrugineum]